MIDDELTYGNIATEIAFVNATEWAQEVSHRRPRSFDSIGMYLTNAIPIIVTRPLFDAVTHS